LPVWLRFLMRTFQRKWKFSNGAQGAVFVFYSVAAARFTSRLS